MFDCSCCCSLVSSTRAVRVLLVCGVSSLQQYSVFCFSCRLCVRYQVGCLSAWDLHTMFGVCCGCCVWSCVGMWGLRLKLWGCLCGVGCGVIGLDVIVFGRVVWFGIAVGCVCLFLFVCGWVVWTRLSRVVVCLVRCCLHVRCCVGG